MLLFLTFLHSKSKKDVNDEKLDIYEENYLIIKLLLKKGLNHWNVLNLYIS